MAGTHIHIHIHAKESTRQIPKETNERTGIWILLLQSTTFSALMLRLFFVLLSPPLIHLPLYPSVHSSLFFSLALSSSFFLSLQLCYCLCVHRTQVESSHIRSLLLDAYTLAFSEVWGRESEREEKRIHLLHSAWRLFYLKQTDDTCIGFFYSLFSFFSFYVWHRWTVERKVSFSLGQCVHCRLACDSHSVYRRR